MLGWTLFAIELGGGAPVTIDQITEQNVDPGLSLILEGASSNVANEFVSIGAQDARVRFTSTAIRVALDAIGTLHAIPIGTGNTYTSVSLYFRRRAEGAQFNAGSAHLKLTINLGFLHWTTLQASQGGNATLQIELIALWDGTNNPIVITKGQALGALVNHTDALWSVGPAYIDDTVELGGVTDLTVESGVQPALTPSDGEVWSRTAHIETRTPTINITGVNMEILDDTDGLGIEGKAMALGAGPTRVFFRKRVEGGRFETDPTAEHIQVGLTQSFNAPSQFGGSERQNATTQILCTPSTNAVGTLPLVLDTAAAITGT